MSFEDKAQALSGSNTCSFHADDIAASEEFRKNYETRFNVVKAADMPWEHALRMEEVAEPNCFTTAAFAGNVEALLESR